MNGLILFGINLAAFIGAALWFLNNPNDLGRLATSLTLLSTLIVQFYVNKAVKQKIKFLVKGKENSTIIQTQASRNTNIFKFDVTNITSTDNQIMIVKKFLLEFAKENMLSYRDVAKNLTDSRINEFNEDFLSEQITNNPQGLREFGQPLFQDALFTAQKQFAMTGDKDLEEILIDILVDLTRHPNRSIRQIVLKEAGFVASKLTLSELDILTLNFLIINVKIKTVKTLEDFKNYIDNILTPFALNLTSKTTSYNYLEFLGCGHIRGRIDKMGYGFKSTNVITKFWLEYSLLFFIGFTEKEFIEEVGDVSKFSWLLMPNLHDHTKKKNGDNLGFN